MGFFPLQEKKEEREKRAPVCGLQETRISRPERGLKGAPPKFWGEGGGAAAGGEIESTKAPRGLVAASYSEP